MSHVCRCHIVPASALRRLAEDPDLSPELRSALEDTLRVDTEVRLLRQQANRLAQVAGPLPALAAAPAGPPDVVVFDTRHGRSLPGFQVSDPATSSDQTVQNVFAETTKVAEFYSSAFGRASIDNAGMTLQSSVHYGVAYNNAAWTGSQMLYGDGDDRLFIDFSKGNDVIGHELTHGVTQYTLQLDYSDDAGGLNESLSDCVGSMFRQWQAGQTVAEADWLIGGDIMGSVAKQKGFTCLRDMADPAAAHCLAAQPTQYADVKPGMDPHFSSGPPNLAFYTACMAAEGKSWETIGKVWYDVMMTAGPHPHLRIPEFAQLTRASASKLFATQASVATAVDTGWKKIGL